MEIFELIEAWAISKLQKAYPKFSNFTLVTWFFDFECASICCCHSGDSYHVVKIMGQVIAPNRKRPMMVSTAVNLDYTGLEELFTEIMEAAK